MMRTATWVFALILGITACGGPAGSEPAATSTSATPQDVPVIGEMSCGEVTVPLSNEFPSPGSRDADFMEAMEWFEGNEEGQYWVDAYNWGLWSKTDSEMILLGVEEGEYAWARFEKDGERWRGAGWGGCQWTPVVNHAWGLAEWRLDEEPVPDATTIPILARERNCANGKAPQGRDIEAIVWENTEAITIFVLVEPVSGGADCPGNPEFSWTVELESPAGGRTLLDGSEVPPAPRGTEPLDH